MHQTPSSASPDWRIYYDNGSTFDSNEGGPEDAPAHGFICAVGYEANGKRYIMHGWDHYRWDRDVGQWWGMDLFGVFDRLRFNKEVFAYKEGRTVSVAIWKEIMDRAHRDPDFPVER